MILEVLQGQGDVWNGATVAVRALYTVGTLGAAGVALFLVFVGDRITSDEMRVARRWLVIFVILGLLASLASWPIRAIVLARGLDGLWRYELYPVIARSRIGDAFFLRMAGLLLVLFTLRRSLWGVALGAVGAVVIAASYAAIGHSTLYRPRQELAALITLHMVAVAFWFGSLMPLRAVTLRRDPRSAAEAIEGWSRWAMLFVVVMTLSGGVASWYLVGTIANLLASWHGWALLAKLSLVAVLFVFALINKVRHTRLMARGDVLAASALRRSITWEVLIAVLVFYAVSEMVSVHPIDYGHRIPG